MTPLKLVMFVPSLTAQAGQSISMVQLSGAGSLNGVEANEAVLAPRPHQVSAARTTVLPASNPLTPAVMTPAPEKDGRTLAERMKDQQASVPGGGPAGSGAVTPTVTPVPVTPRMQPSLQLVGLRSELLEAFRPGKLYDVTITEHTVGQAVSKTGYVQL